MFSFKDHSFVSYFRIIEPSHENDDSSVSAQYLLVFILVSLYIRELHNGGLLITVVNGWEDEVPYRP
jgi:hypothetical protein